MKVFKMCMQEETNINLTIRQNSEFHLKNEVFKT
jgi:hypothetical protein